MAPQLEYVLRTVEERGVRFVQLWFTDVLGALKGFAITLIIGMICSFFTGVFCTRVVFDWWARGKTNKISVGAEF
mgnify:CR=1 FL=1